MPGTACACATHTPTGLCFVWPGCALLQARGVLVSGHHPGIKHTAQILRTCCTVGESSQWPVLAIAAFWGASGRAHSGTCPKPLAPSPLPEARPVPGGGPGPISQVHVAFPPSAAGLEKLLAYRPGAPVHCGPLATGVGVVVACRAGSESESKDRSGCCCG